MKPLASYWILSLITLCGPALSAKTLPHSCRSTNLYAKQSQFGYALAPTADAMVVDKPRFH